MDDNQMDQPKEKAPFSAREDGLLCSVSHRDLACQREDSMAELNEITGRKSCAQSEIGRGGERQRGRGLEEMEDLDEEYSDVDSSCARYQQRNERRMKERQRVTHSQAFASKQEQNQVAFDDQDLMCGHHEDHSQSFQNQNDYVQIDKDSSTIKDYGCEPNILISSALGKSKDFDANLSQGSDAEFKAFHVDTQPDEAHNGDHNTGMNFLHPHEEQHSRNALTMLMDHQDNAHTDSQLQPLFSFNETEQQTQENVLCFMMKEQQHDPYQDKPEVAMAAIEYTDSRDSRSNRRQSAAGSAGEQLGHDAPSNMSYVESSLEVDEKLDIGQGLERPQCLFQETEQRTGNYAGQMFGSATKSSFCLNASPAEIGTGHAHMMEESLRLNPDNGIPIYQKRGRHERGQSPLSNQHNESSVVIYNSQSDLQNQSISNVELKRPSTIQEVSDALMEETDCNKSSILYNSICYYDQHNFKGFIHVPSSGLGSGAVTPYYAYGNANTGGLGANNMSRRNSKAAKFVKQSPLLRSCYQSQNQSQKGSIVCYDMAPTAEHGSGQDGSIGSRHLFQSYQEDEDQLLQGQNSLRRSDQYTEMNKDSFGNHYGMFYHENGQLPPQMTGSNSEPLIVQNAAIDQSQQLQVDGFTKGRVSVVCVIRDGNHDAKSSKRVSKARGLSQQSLLQGNWSIPPQITKQIGRRSSSYSPWLCKRKPELKRNASMSSVYSLRSSNRSRTSQNQAYRIKKSSVKGYSKRSHSNVVQTRRDHAIESQDNSTEIQKPLRFFTYSDELGGVVLVQQVEHSSKSFIQNEVIESSFLGPNDLDRFISGLYNQESDEPNLRLLNFDLCISEQQHPPNHLEQMYLSLFKDHLQQRRDHQINTLTFFFGTSTLNDWHHSFSNQSRNGSPTNLPISAYLNQITSPKSVRITVYFLRQEKVLVEEELDKCIKQTKPNQSDSLTYLNGLIQKALNKKERYIQSLESKDPQMATIVEKCSHLVVQIDDHFLVDMAGLEGLQSHEPIHKRLHRNQSISEQLTDDFGILTNEILRQSPFYQNHQFVVNSNQQQSSLLKFLQRNLGRRSKLLLVACIENDKQLPDGTRSADVSSSIAIDFAHKIRSFFDGQSDACQIQEIIAQIPKDQKLKTQEEFSQIQMIFQKMKDLHTIARMEHNKIHRQVQFIISKQRVEEIQSNQIKLIDSISQFGEMAKSIIANELTLLQSSHLYKISCYVQKSLHEIKGFGDQVDGLLAEKLEMLEAKTRKPKDKNLLSNSFGSFQEFNRVRQSNSFSNVAAAAGGGDQEAGAKAGHAVQTFGDKNRRHGYSKDGLGGNRHTKRGSNSYRVEALHFHSTRKSFSATGSCSQMETMPSGIFCQEQQTKDAHGQDARRQKLNRKRSMPMLTDCGGIEYQPREKSKKLGKNRKANLQLPKQKMNNPGATRETVSSRFKKQSKKALVEQQYQTRQLLINNLSNPHINTQLDEQNDGRLTLDKKSKHLPTASSLSHFHRTKVSRTKTAIVRKSQKHLKVQKRNPQDFPRFRSTDSRLSNGSGIRNLINIRINRKRNEDEAASFMPTNLGQFPNQADELAVSRDHLPSQVRSYDGLAFRDRSACGPNVGNKLNNLRSSSNWAVGSQNQQNNPKSFQSYQIKEDFNENNKNEQASVASRTMDGRSFDDMSSNRDLLLQNGLQGNDSQLITFDQSTRMNEQLRDQANKVNDKSFSQHCPNVVHKKGSFRHQVELDLSQSHQVQQQMLSPARSSAELMQQEKNLHADMDSRDHHNARGTPEQTHYLEGIILKLMQENNDLKNAQMEHQKQIHEEIQQNKDLTKQLNAVKIQNTVLKSKEQNKKNEQAAAVKTQLQQLQAQVGYKDEQNRKLSKQLAENKNAFKTLQQKYNLKETLREQESKTLRHERIESLKEERRAIAEEVRKRDEQISKLKGRQLALQTQIIQQQDSIQELLNQISMEKKAKRSKSSAKGGADAEIVQTLKQKLNQMKQMHVNLEQIIEDKEDEIEKLEETRDQFRDQALDLKQEIRQLKRQRRHRSSRKRQQYSSLSRSKSTRSFSKENKENQSAKINIKESIQRKNEVLRDIRLLLKDYKKPVEMDQIRKWSRSPPGPSGSNDHQLSIRVGEDPKGMKMKTIQDYEEDNTYGQNTLSTSILSKQQKRLGMSAHHIDGDDSSNSSTSDLRNAKGLRALNDRTANKSTTSFNMARNTASPSLLTSKQARYSQNMHNSISELDRSRLQRGTDPRVKTSASRNSLDRQHKTQVSRTQTRSKPFL